MTETATTTPSRRPPPDSARERKELEALPHVARFADKLVRERVVGLLYAARRSPAHSNALGLLLGGGFDPARVGRYHVHNALDASPMLHELPDAALQLRILKTFARLATVQHADNLRTMVRLSRLPCVSGEALQQAYWALHDDPRYVEPVRYA